MKTYKSSALTNNKRAEVFREAEKNGVIIQQCRTNGEVVVEFVLLAKTVITSSGRDELNLPFSDGEIYI